MSKKFFSMRDIKMPVRPAIRKIGAMQPYLFPYLGYFQLISAVDAFVLGDDLQYVKQSWINRNRVLVNHSEKMISFPVKKGSHCARINEKVFSDDFRKEREGLLKLLSNAYANACCFNQVYPMLEAVLLHDEPNLAKYAEHSIRTICDYLEIRTRIHISSSLPLDTPRDKQERVIQTVHALNGNTYVNPIGGLGLYDAARFDQHGITLQFHRMNEFQYKQFENPFLPSLSIIDVLMFNRRSKVIEMLEWYVHEDQASALRSKANAIPIDTELQNNFSSCE